MSTMPWRKSDGPRSSGSQFTQLRSDWDRMLDRVLDDFLGGTTGGQARREMPLDVIETDGELSIKVELPGLEPENVDVSLAGDVLTIQGQKQEERNEETSRYHLTERRYGSFQRSIPLPTPVEPESVAAEMRNGLLTITLKKSEATRPRKISVRGA